MKLFRVYVVMLSLIGLLFLIWKCQTYTEAAVYLNHADSVRYVGMQTCKSCHFKTYESYIKTGMGHSFGMASKSRSKASFGPHISVYDSISNYHYQPFWRQDSFYIMEYRLFKEDTIHKRIEHVKYIIGSGQHTNSHLISQNEYLTQAPITFYTQSQKWDMAPGFNKGFNSRFERLIKLECMSCHNGLPGLVEGSENKYSKVPMGIDCERCHGPGSLHVEQKRKGIFVDTSKYIDYTIVNPGKLSAELQNSLCQRCHLQGISVLNVGKEFDDFKPGQHLSEVMKVFMPDYGNSKGFIMASHVERMKKSLCYIESQSLSCISCHNPHKSVKETPKKHFISTCMQCHSKGLKHQKAQNDEGDCISCHMPQSGSVDIPHVAITDHRIQIQGDKPFEDSDFKGLVCVSDDKTTPLELARAYLAYFDKFQQDSSMLDSVSSLIDKNATNKDSWNGLRLHYLFNLQNWTEIIKLSQSYKTLIAWENYRIGEAYFQQANWSLAISYFQKALNKAPLNPAFKIKLSSAYFQNMEVDKATRLFKEVLAEQPNNVLANYNLALCYLYSGKKGIAKMLFKKVISLNPDMPKAWIKLIGLLERNSEEYKTYYSLYKKNRSTLAQEK